MIPEPFVLPGSSFEVCWQVSGCHKIVISDAVYLSGNSSGIQLPANYAKERLVIRFYGQGKMIERSLPVCLMRTSLKKSLVPSLEELAEPLVRKQLQKSMTKRFSVRRTYKEQVRLSMIIKLPPFLPPVSGAPMAGSPVPHVPLNH